MENSHENGLPPIGDTVFFFYGQVVTFFEP